MKGCVVENNKKKTTTTWWKKMMTTCLFIYLWRTKKNDENDYQQFYSFVYYVWMRNHHHHHHYNHYSTLIIFKRVPSAMQIFCVAKHLLISFSNLCFLFFSHVYITWCKMASALTMRHRLLHEQMDKKQRKRNLIRMKNVCVCAYVCMYICVLLVKSLIWRGMEYRTKKKNECEMFFDRGDIDCVCSVCCTLDHNGCFWD